MGNRIVIMLGGRDMTPADRYRWGEVADDFVGADSGGDRLLEAGLPVQILIGDLDSASDVARKAAEKGIHITEQESTDFEKALTYVEEAYSGHEVLILGSEGDRADHVFAAWQSAARSTLRIAFGLRSGLAVKVNGNSLGTISVPDRTAVSLLPLTQCTGVNLSGVHWPLADAVLEPAGRQSISNISTGPIELSIDEGIAYLFLGVPVGTWLTDLSPSYVQKMSH